ncbi:hypothetical protein [Streptomyces varsoviensis]|uniref:Uncharacterized protein n=1 Tax=Streptomyces varsoviensis TaxID=67373 RepID=A0ABR5IVP0_9ACTN|nr:hypothetical protein [Streptomyces varsoviensis]KOG85207.1 hypothetical protein ADK38_37955 [Streptomyces varsoviensis]
MNDDLWDRLPRDVRDEVDRLIEGGRNIHAIVLMRERGGDPMPGIHECVDLLEQRCVRLRLVVDDRHHRANE